MTTIYNVTPQHLKYNIIFSDRVYCSICGRRKVDPGVKCICYHGEQETPNFRLENEYHEHHCKQRVFCTRCNSVAYETNDYQKIFCRKCDVHEIVVVADVSKVISDEQIIDNRTKEGGSNMFPIVFEQVNDDRFKFSVYGTAIKTGDSNYVAFDGDKLVNVHNFVFDGYGLFYKIPSMAVSKGDVILVNGKPYFVKEAGSGKTVCLDPTNGLEVNLADMVDIMGIRYYVKVINALTVMMPNLGLFQTTLNNDLFKAMLASSMLNNNTAIGNILPWILFSNLGGIKPEVNN